MRHLFSTLLIALLVSSLFLGACSDKSAEDEENPDIAPTEPDAVLVVVETSEGNFTLELDSNRAPVTVKNFLAYVDDGFYEGTTFHRVITGFMIQGGGFEEDLNKKTKDLKAPIQNEAENKLSNERGTVAMARTSIINSATSQFFINLSNNVRLDHRGTSPREFGYAVFGKVVDGMETIDTIAGVKVDCPSSPPGSECDRPLNGLRDVPAKAVVIKSITRKD